MKKKIKTKQNIHNKKYTKQTKTHKDGTTALKLKCLLFYLALFSCGF